MIQVSLPYIDEPREFWRDVAAALGDRIHEIYFPLPRSVFGSGRPVLPSEHLLDFLEVDALPKGVLLNPASLDGTYAEAVERLFPYLEWLTARYRIDGVTVKDVRLLADIKCAFPSLLRCASTLMEISCPEEVRLVSELVDVIAPASWVVRDYATLSALRRAIQGSLKLLVNEGCLLRCPWRKEHFEQMNSAMADPPTLCLGALERQPWLRITGAWILPQHLDLLDGLFDIVKVAGRGTIHGGEEWMAIATAYLEGRPLTPDRIGVGPSGVVAPWIIDRAYYETTLHCDKRCSSCRICAEYHGSLGEP